MLSWIHQRDHRQADHQLLPHKTTPCPPSAFCTTTLQGSDVECVKLWQITSNGTSCLVITSKIKKKLQADWCDTWHIFDSEPVLWQKYVSWDTKMIDLRAQKVFTEVAKATHILTQSGDVWTPSAMYKGVLPRKTGNTLLSPVIFGSNHRPSTRSLRDQRRSPSKKDSLVWINNHSTNKKNTSYNDLHSVLLF